MHLRGWAIAFITLLLAGCLPSQAPPPPQAPPLYKDPAAPVHRRVDDLLGRMTLEEKVGQMTQVDLQHVIRRPEAITTYGLGSVLSGGGSVPVPNTAKSWADTIDSFQQAARKSRLAIPILYGTDTVHGHNNLYGATIFPHNIGLGATRNPDLVRRIGAVTAREALATGVRWNFGPCLCVLRDERWGRSYECFGEEPDLVSSLTTIVVGLQGERLGPVSVMATAKHWVADGGTVGGKDQGDAQLSEEELRRLHIAPYKAAIDRGVGAVMLSFSSWNGQKVHGHTYLVTDLLKGELGFSGIVVTDWAGHKQLTDDYAAAVRMTVNAGADMVMVPDDYHTFIHTLVAEVKAGRVAMDRIDDAVRRILTKKFELGLFEQPLTDRSALDAIGSAEHRALARQAVRESVVLLKNDGGLLPLTKEGRFFVAGKNADDLGNQMGGWTMTWQGKSGRTTVGTTILEGIRQVAPGATITYQRDGEGLDSSYDAAILVVGELPYAEFEGDRPGGLDLDAADQALVARAHQAGVKVVLVLVSGRPLVVTEQIEQVDAFLAAWLPGTEGAGVADVLFGEVKPSGKLPVSWPRSNQQLPVNVGDPAYSPLFPFGFGLTYP
ncbi:MAG: glycoside hydrolase family 3 protein [Bacillota bacterium]